MTLQHNPNALLLESHVCFEWGCSAVNSYRQSERIDLKPDIEDYSIRYFQALFNIGSKTKPRTLLTKYWNRITHILFKWGHVGVYKDSNGQPIFGYLRNVYYNVVGDVVRFDLGIKLYGQQQMTSYRDSYFWDLIKNDSFAIELPRKKGLKASYSTLINQLNNADDNIRINQDNSMIKYYYDAGVIPEDTMVQLSTVPAVNNMGIAVTTTQMIPIQRPKVNGSTDSEKDDGFEQFKEMFANQLEGKGLIKNDYQDNTAQSINNYNFLWNRYCLFAGIRENRNVKKANLHDLEVEYSNFSFNITENYYLEILQTLVYEWNELFGEDNVIEKSVDITEQDVTNNTNNILDNAFNESMEEISDSQ